MTSDIMQEAKRRLATGGSIDAVLGFFRESGLSKIWSVKAVSELLECSLDKAKRIVHDSVAWQDVHDSHEDFLDTLVHEIEKEEGK